MKPLNRSTIIKILQAEKPYLRDQFGVEKVGLFGSFAREEATENSDVDLVVSLEKPLGFAFVQLADYLEERLGCKVDLITFSTLEMGLADPRKRHITLDIEESLIHV